ncbi:MAG: accessory factor UbiK family protein [Gammaproteobacteria bacterium]
MNDENSAYSAGLRERLARILEGVPAEEFKKNARETAAAILARLNVVGREEFDAHCEMLARAVIRLREMEKQIARLEKTSAAAAPSKKSRTKKIATKNETPKPSA